MKNFCMPLICMFLSCSCLFGAGKTISAQERQRLSLIEKAVDFLRKNQAPNGAFSPQTGIGPTAVVVVGLLDTGMKPDDPMLAKALKLLADSAQPNGSITSEGSRFQNYETSLAVVGLSAANKQLRNADGKGPYDQILLKAETFLRSCQYTDANDNVVKEEFRGGVGYAPGQEAKRPDLSNVHFFLDAMKSLGRGPDDPAVKEALIFVSRCQNLESEHNTLPWAAKNPDGGFVYLVANEAAEKESEERVASGREAFIFRSYGSMSYAGLKSMVYAGLTKDDKRIKAAYEWTRKYYTLDENPGAGQSGLYYYYMLFAKTLDTMGLAVMEDAGGIRHDWRAELIAALGKRQQANGSWVNEINRWMEGDANIVTGYALMALAHCRE